MSRFIARKLDKENLMQDRTPIVSPSRTYVAMCNKTNWDGYYFRRFVLPENTPANRAQTWGGEAYMYEDAAAKKYSRAKEFQITNDAEFASWYYLNKLNFTACIEKCIPLENFLDVEDEVRLCKDGQSGCTERVYGSDSRCMACQAALEA
jgi:hypothetical protein